MLSSNSMSFDSFKEIREEPAHLKTCTKRCGRSLYEQAVDSKPSDNIASRNGCERQATGKQIAYRPSVHADLHVVRTTPPPTSHWSHRSIIYWSAAVSGLSVNCFIRTNRSIAADRRHAKRLCLSLIGFFDSKLQRLAAKEAATSPALAAGLTPASSAVGL